MTESQRHKNAARPQDAAAAAALSPESVLKDLLKVRVTVRLKQTQRVLGAIADYTVGTVIVVAQLVVAGMRERRSYRERTGNARPAGTPR